MTTKPSDAHLKWSVLLSLDDRAPVKKWAWDRERRDVTLVDVYDGAGAMMWVPSLGKEMEDGVALFDDEFVALAKAAEWLAAERDRVADALLAIRVRLMSIQEGETT